jgi:hemoglobin-like flavoprotein
VPHWPTLDEIAVVQFSLDKIVPHADLIAERFYAKVFDAAPEVRLLFPDDMRVQRNKFVEMLAFVVSNLGKPEELDHRLKSLGERHRSYGVQRIHFVVVRAALVETLAESTEIKFTNGELAAWDNLFRYMAKGMGVSLARAA